MTLFVPGRPVPKGRPRTRVQRGKTGKVWAQIYSDPATVTWESHVEWHATQQLLGLSGVTWPLRGRVLASLRFNLVRPKSAPKSLIYPIRSRSDVDNLTKAVLDALQNAGIISNDNIVTDLMVTKRFADDRHPEGVEIDLTGVLG